MSETSASRIYTTTGEDGVEPLLEIHTSLDEVISGEDSTFRTENASNFDFERKNVVDRTGGNVHIQLQLLEVRHGNYDDDGDEATLMVFRFRFDPQKASSRVIRATVTFEFFPSRSSSQAPAVDAIAPEGL